MGRACRVGVQSFLQYRAAGGVLQLTLGISLVISMLCAAMILIVYFSRLTFLQQEVADTLRDHATSGVYYAMAQRRTLPALEPHTIDLFGNGTDSVEIMRKPWGVFELVVATACRGGHQHTKTALLAAEPDTLGQAALYVANRDAPLYLVGNTQLTGTAYLSESKLATGFIDGQGYTNPTFITGTVKQSARNLPALAPGWLAHIDSILADKPSAYQCLSLNHFPAQETFSFNTLNTPYYFSHQSIELNDSLAGNVIIQSAMRIRITAGAVLKDVIVIAPTIDIADHVTGSFQCFATRAITVGQESTLQYPSALVLMGSADGQDSTVVIQAQARVEGVVVVPGYDASTPSTALVTLEAGAVLHGMAYVNARANVQGQVRGLMMARTMVAKKGSSVYTHHLLNADINGTTRSPYMPACWLWGHTGHPVVARWLNDTAL